MDKLGLNINLLSMQVIHFMILAGWPTLIFAALVVLRRSGMTGRLLLGWTLLVVLVPWLGALAYLIVRPDGQPTTA